MTHTPGPWRFDPDDGAYVTTAAEAGWQQRIIAQVHGDWNTNEIQANGHLLAAAPQLLWLVEQFIGGAALMTGEMGSIITKAELLRAQLKEGD